MKKLTWIFFTVLCTLFFGAVSASDNGKSGYNGSPGENNCTACHADFAVNSGGGSVSVTSNIPGWTYTPGQTYTINVTVTHSGAALFGWGLEALKSDGSSGGKMLITDGAKSQILYKTISAKSRANFVHKLDGGAANNTFTISFDWLAPTADSGNVTLYFVGMGADYDASESNDYVYTGTQVINKPVANIPLVLNCATNLNVAACQSQTAINTAFTNWIATTTISGGCSASLSNNSSGAPLACGGSKTVTWTATSTCGSSQSCSATFTVDAASPVVLTCATDQTEAGTQSQATIDALFSTWLNSATVSGGCNTVLTNNGTVAPPTSGGSTTVTWTATSDCESNVTCSATFTVTPPPVYNLSVNSLPKFFTKTGQGSTAQSFTVSAADLADDLIIWAPDPFQVSLTGTNGNWRRRVILTPDVNGDVPVTTIYVRFKPTIAGSYDTRVRLIYQGATAKKIHVTGSTTLKLADSNIENGFDVMLTPNPAVNSLNITLSDNQKANVTLFNLTGNKLQTLTDVSGTVTMDVSQLPEGLYFCRIESGNAIITKKFVKQ